MPEIVWTAPRGEWEAAFVNVREAMARREQERTRLTDRLTRLLADDQRVLAGWLHGSVGRGEADGLSDLDVTVVVADDAMVATTGGPGRPTTYEQVRTSPRGRFVAGLGQPTLLTEAPQNAPAGGAFLSSFFSGEYGPHGIDGEWIPRSTAAQPENTLLLLDRRGTTAPESPSRSERGSHELTPGPAPRSPLETAVAEYCSFWAMLMWAGKYAARADPDGCATLLAYAVRSLDVVTRFAGVTPPTAPSATTGLSAAAVGERLRAQARSLWLLADRMDALAPRLDERDVVLPEDVSSAVRRYLRLVEELVGAGGGDGR
ncbi:nucleotidyltransferase domain-containing protein [Actinopolymorpha sp. NPDC004070]|uniref:nucleotidyltransferase domain-containing protein n=1 Tax=Actinopolymorpha sp. NPDC004070 TaxID=3154548 RepID=UPI00339F5D9E